MSSDAAREPELRTRADFPVPSLADWEQQVERELKGRYESLIHTTEDGFDVPPLLTAADLDGLPHLTRLADAPLFGGKLRATVAVSGKDVNTAARALLEAGADAVRIPYDTGSGDAALAGLDPEKVLLSAAPGEALDGAFARDGFRVVPNLTRDTVPASSSEELTCVLSHAISLIREAAARDEVAARLVLSFQVGPVLFEEIAKLRAARLLWGKIARAFEIDPNGTRFHVYVSPYWWTRYDVHSNLLRQGLGAFAAAVAGCDYVEPGSFDGTAAEAGSAAVRRALGELRLMIGEAYLDRVADPAAGSYAVERLTHEIGASTWAGIQAMEHSGGFPAPEDGSGWQRREPAVIRAHIRRMSRGRHGVPLVGVSLFADPADPGVPEGSFDGPRAGQVHEHLRDRANALTRANGRRPTFLALVVGTADVTHPHVVSVNRFVRAGGFATLPADAAADTGTALEVVARRTPDVVAICGHPGDFDDIVPRFVERVRQADHCPAVYVVATAIGAEDEWEVDGILHPDFAGIEHLDRLLDQVGAPRDPGDGA